MKKVYLNNYYNKALIINEGAHTYTLTSAETARTIRFKIWTEGAHYPAKVERIRELLGQLKARGFKRV